MTIRCLAFREADASWDELTRGLSPLVDAAWHRAFIDAFGEDARVVFHRVERDGACIAQLPLVLGRDKLARVWTSLDNEHHPYAPIAGTLDDAAAEQLLGYLLADTDYLFLRRLPMQAPSTQALVAAARALALPCVQIESELGDARIVLTGDWQEFRSCLPNNFQRDLPRKQRKLARLGTLRYGEIVAPGPELDAALEECFDVETRGWKGREGSPILASPATLRFYRGLARELAATGRFCLYTLRLDDKIIAFEYCLRGGGHIEMLKLSFDPAYAQQSPGQVLRMFLLERELARGEIRYYHLGRPSEWKLRWATEVAPLCTLRIYGRGARARAAHLLGPVLRSQVKRVLRSAASSSRP